GEVLDPAPPRRIDPERLAVLERGDPIEIAYMLAAEPVTFEALQALGLLSPAELATGVAALERAGDWAYRPTWLEGVRALVRARLAGAAEAHPLDPGIALGELLPNEPWT